MKVACQAERLTSCLSAQWASRLHDVDTRGKSQPWEGRSTLVGLAPLGKGKGRRWQRHDPIKFVDNSIVVEVQNNVPTPRELQYLWRKCFCFPMCTLFFRIKLILYSLERMLTFFAWDILIFRSKLVIYIIPFIRRNLGDFA
jgi:hypothetical protein